MDLKIHEFKKNEKLFFLTDNLKLTQNDIIKLYPRIPRRRLNLENSDIKRISIGNKIYRILKAVPMNWQTAKTKKDISPIHFTVFKAIEFNLNKIVEPTIEEVEDVNTTHELWSLSPITFQKIGSLNVYDSMPCHYYEYSLKRNMKIPVNSRKNIDWEWIEKPQEKI